MINHVMLQGVLFINGIEDMRLERKGYADTERRYSGHITTASKSENGYHNIRISSEHGADKIVAQWVNSQHDQSIGLEAIVEGKLMTVFADNTAYVLVEYVRFIGTGNLTMRNGNFSREHSRRVGEELAKRGKFGSRR